MPQWVTLLPEACTGAVCAHCKEHKENLTKCGRCKRAWYCSKEHQKEDYPEHKATCRVAAPFVDALIESVADFKPPPSSYVEVQRIIAAATLYAGRHGPQGPLRNNIFSYLSNTVFCRVCFKLREQLAPGSHLVCCPKCLWGWCCQEHWQEFEPQHQPYCAEYATMRRLHALQRQQAGTDLFSGPQLPYPMGKVTQLQQNQMLQSWERYRRLRLASVTNDDTWRLMSDDMSVPLTAVWATRLLYSKEAQGGLKDFNLHLVGAANYEFQHVMANVAVEEALHLLPAAKRLHVTLVGPEWKLISPGPTYTTHDKMTCPPCKNAGCKRIISIYRGTYEAFAASKEWTTPTLALACNSGVGCEDEENWARAVKVLLDKNIPSCFTSMNAAEMELDAAALKKAGAAVLHQGRNTFSSLVPLRDFDAGADEFYYTNGFVITFKGRAAAAAGSTAASSCGSC